mgnify:CR=1 FL=1
MKEIIAKIEQDIINKNMSLKILLSYIKDSDKDTLDIVDELTKESSIITNYLENFFSHMPIVTEEKIRKMYNEEEADILVFYCVLKGKINDDKVDYKLDNINLSSSLKMYLQEIKSYPILDNETILYHIEMHHKNIKLFNETNDKTYYDKAIYHRDICIHSNLRLVVYFANKYGSKTIPVQDLIAEGNIGLIKAVEKFDTNLKTKFTTYASFWINQKINRYLKENGKMIKIPIHSQTEYLKYKRVVEDYQKAYGHQPSEEELVDMLGLNPEKIKRIEEQTVNIVSLDDKLDEDDAHSLDNYNIVASGEFEEDIINKETIKKLLDTLNEKEKLIIAYRYGLVDGRDWTLKEIGETLGITRERVRQIEDKIIKKLRRRYAGKKAFITICEYFKRNKTDINKAFKYLSDIDKETLQRICGSDLSKPINIKLYTKSPLKEIVKNLRDNFKYINPQFIETNFKTEYQGKRLLEIISRKRFEELIKLDHTSKDYTNLTLVFGLNMLYPANFENENIDVNLLIKTLDIKKNAKSVYEGKILPDIIGGTLENVLFYLQELGTDSKKYRLMIDTFGPYLTKRYLIQNAEIESILKELINEVIPNARILKGKTLQQVLNLTDEEYYYFLENRQKSEYKSDILTKFFGENLTDIYNNKDACSNDLKSLRISLTKLIKKEKDLSIEKNKLKTSFENKTLQEYLELSDEEFEHIKTLFNKKATYYQTLTKCFKDDLSSTYIAPRYYDAKIISMQITLKNLKEKLHKKSPYYKKTYHDLIKVVDLIKFNKEELEILKKAFGNNLNIGYLNTLSNKEEEKLISIINEYYFDSPYQSKLNKNLKEIIKNIPINYRLPLELYLGIYDNKKYTIDELSIILNLPPYEIKSRIKNGIIYIKNILNTKDLEAQKELTRLIKSL